MAWRAHLQNEMYCMYASKIVAKLSSKQTPASTAKWSMFIMGTSFCWCTTGFCIRPFVLFNLHKWLNKGYFINQQLFADDTSIFSIANNINVSEHELNSYLRKRSMWAYQWKMSFNPNVSKQAQEMIFSKKNQKVFHPTVLFNNIPARHSKVQKHLGVYLDEKLNFNTFITEK